MDFDASQPIYRQIIDSFKKQLIRGELEPGDKIPSQREYAERARVNPNTVQRAYREMEMMQMVETQRGQGTFISATTDMVVAMKVEMATSVIGHFFAEMSELGFTPQEINDLLVQQMRQMQEGEMG